MGGEDSRDGVDCLVDLHYCWYGQPHEVVYAWITLLPYDLEMYSICIHTEIYIEGYGVETTAEILSVVISCVLMHM